METQKSEKHLRKRKKKLLNSIREQIEFYFSDANLRHDRFMRQLIGAEDETLNGKQWVDLNQFIKFNKISEMTQSIRDISLALESSKCLTLDPNQLKVKRIEPFVDNDLNYDESTVYVERLPPNADQHWIRSVFGVFGRIQYVKVPHFRHNHNIMGFAFIEFADKESADKALKHFNRLTASDSHSDSQSDPIQTQTQTQTLTLTLTQTETKIKTQVLGKRIAETTEEEEVIESKRVKVEESDPKSDSEVKTEDKTEIISKTNKKKKKRRRKRKIVTTDQTEDNESEIINLRVMSKKEWKSWKNKYLKLQKQTMSSIKRSLLVSNEENSREETDCQSTQVNDSNHPNDRCFETGLIIKLQFNVSSNEFNDNQFKRNIRLMADRHEISYIDLPNNQIEFKDNQTICGVCYIRTNSSQDCNQLVSNEKLKQLGDLAVLEGKEESDYWNKIFEQRMLKKSNNNCITNKSRNKNNLRGFDKIINRAENVMTIPTKLNKHIKFDN